MITEKPKIVINIPCIVGSLSILEMFTLAAATVVQDTVLKLRTVASVRENQTNNTSG